MNTFKLTMVLLEWNAKMLMKWLSEQFWRCFLLGVSILIISTVHRDADEDDSVSVQ